MSIMTIMSVIQWTIFTYSSKIISREAIHIPSVFSKGSDDEAALFSQSAYRVHMQVQSAPIKSGYPSKDTKRKG